MGGIFNLFRTPKFPEPPPDTSKEDAEALNKRRLKSASQSREQFARSASTLGPIQLQAPGVRRPR